MSKRSGRMLPVCSSFLLAILASLGLIAQTPDTHLPSAYKTVAADAGFLDGISNNGLMGQRYRLEWSVPVRVPVVSLDTLRGGLVPIKTGAGGQAQVLYLQSNTGEEYTLRSVQKLPERQLPDIYRNTFIADMANDMTSAFHPYAPLTIAPLAQAAGIRYTPPQLVYLPSQAALGVFNAAIGNGLYWLQQEPASVYADTTNHIISTARLLHLLDSSNQYRIDAHAYLRIRLLDMLLGITKRGADQWRWLAQPKGSTTVFLPLPDNYEGAYALYQGRFLQFAKAIAKLKGLQSFDHRLPDPRKLNALALHLDRHFTNSLSKTDWENTVRSMRQALTDAVLQNALRQLPAEVQSISASTILSKLRNRRNALEQYALEYYQLLSEVVDITGTAQAETISVHGGESGEVAISLSPRAAAQAPSDSALLSRTFQPGETKAVNIYGMGGEDLFVIAGKRVSKLKVRLVGGPQQDSITGEGEGGNIHFYDSRSIATPPNGHTRLHLTNRLSVHRYDWESFAFNTKGFRPMVFYNNNDRIFAGVSYQWTRHGWRKEPFAQQHRIYLNYSLVQGGISAGYEGVFNQVIGAWNGLLSTEYDAVRWTNFFGIGNESPPQATNDNNFYRMRTEISLAQAGLFRMLGSRHSIGFAGQYQTVRILRDVERFVSKTLTQEEPMLFRTRQFAGVRATYNYQNLNNDLVPSKGLLFNGNIGYTKNLTFPDKEVVSYGSSLQAFVPLGKRWVLSSLGGLSAVTGQPEFYQLATVGGGATIRGFRRERFWGKTAFYNQNELQYLMPFRSYWFNGTVGLFGLFDAGRVWQPGEISNLMHKSFGGGLILVPFNKVRLMVAYARSEERGMIHVGFRGRL